MARRYGGRYSPGADRDDARTPPGPPPNGAAAGYDGAQRDPVGARSNVLFLPPILLAFLSLNDGAAGLAVGLSGAGAILLGAWLLREGLRAEAAFDARRIARRTALPRNILAAALCGTGTALAAFRLDPWLLAPAIYGAAAAGLHLLAFGPDPLRDKGLGEDDFRAGRVARVVEDAEAYLAETHAAILPLRDRDLEARMDRFAATVRRLIARVEEDPRDLTAARRYLGVYLMGARDAAQRYARLQGTRGDSGARADFLQLIADLEDGFGAKTEALLLDDATDLTVEIDVLRERLAREGVQLDRQE